MNLRPCAISVLCIVLSSPLLAQTEDMDKALLDLGTKLATQVKENGKKKITVLDFTDLQGGSTELGKYIAEQLTVNLVIGKRDFSVLDRANLKSILTEHKLTATGLVNPENAKKLGMFAGVDALILGNIIPKSKSISLTVKIITTDTAEIVGAARAEFVTDEVVKQLESRPAKAEETKAKNESTPEGNESRPAPVIPKPFGDLRAIVESFKLLPGDESYGYARLTLVITNTSDSKTYGLCFPAGPFQNVHLTNSRGEELGVTELEGVETGGQDINGRFYGSLTDVLPGNAITVVSKHQVRWTGKPGDYRPYRLQAVLIFGLEENGRHPGLKKYNLLVDIK